MEEKRRLRKAGFAAVRGLGDEKKAEASRQICGHLRKWPVFEKAKGVGVFIAARSEPDLGELIWETGNSGRFFALPWIDPQDETLRFYEINSEADLVIGDFGIAEPRVEKCRKVGDEELDLVLVPGVGFDLNSRARLGRGKGHYDRFLARLRSAAKNDCPVIGVCFSVQLAALKTEAHDEPMDGVVTEKGGFF